MSKTVFYPNEWKKWHKDTDKYVSIYLKGLHAMIDRKRNQSPIITLFTDYMMQIFADLYHRTGEGMEPEYIEKDFFVSMYSYCSRETIEIMIALYGTRRPSNKWLEALYQILIESYWD